MTWEGVPWTVANAEHSVEVGRLVGHLAGGGQDGIVQPTDLKVTPLNIPGAGVLVNSGAVVMVNRFEGGESQSYIARNVGADTVAMDPQGSAGVRYDLVAVVVEDPQYAGQPAPASVEQGPYVRTKVYKGVASTVRTLAEVDPDQTGYALARVRFDASDGTVTLNDIVDLRTMSNPKFKQAKRMFQSGSSGTIPGALNNPIPSEATFSVVVPEWAVKMQMEAHWSGLRMTDSGADGGTAAGYARVAIGAVTSADGQWAENAVGPGRVTTTSMMVADEKDVPVTMRGTTQTVKAMLSKTSGSNMDAAWNTYTTCIITVTFYEEATYTLEV